MISLIILLGAIFIAWLIIAAAVKVVRFLYRLGGGKQAPQQQVEETGTLPSILDLPAKGEAGNGH